MTRTILYASVLAAAALYVAPASAAPVLDGNPAVIATPTSGAPGTLVTSSVIAVTAPTFSGTLYAAVYQDATTGFLDFVYQVARTGGTDAIERLTAGSFAGYSVDAYEDATGNFGPFITASNGLGDAATVKLVGSSLSVFLNNPLDGTEVSGVYIIKTNATGITPGMFSLQDFTSVTGNWLAPSLPEPASWGLMLLGFGGIGFVLRRKNAASHISQIA